jgi:hypothetical protein
MLRFVRIELVEQRLDDLVVDALCRPRSRRVDLDYPFKLTIDPFSFGKC